MLTRQIEHRIQSSDVTNPSNFPAANTAAVITLVAVENRRNIIHFAQWSYSAAPTGGRLTITVAGTTVKDMDIIAGGPGGFSFYVVGGINQEVVITLAAGGVGITGRLMADVTRDAL